MFIRMYSIIQSEPDYITSFSYVQVFSPFVVVVPVFYKVLEGDEQS
jgi:hypothetical protein